MTIFGISLLLFFISFYSALAIASIVTWQHMPLNRSPVEIYNAVKPLMTESTAISLDGSRILLRGKKEEVVSFSRLIKSLDKKQQRLKVSIFRGRSPYKEGSIIVSTQQTKNQQHELSVHEGQMLAVIEQGVVKIPVSTSQYLERGEQFATTNSSSNNVLQASPEDENISLLPWDSSDGAENPFNINIVTDGSNEQEGIHYNRKDFQLVDVPSGIYLRVNLQSKKTKEALISAKVIIAEDNRNLSDGASQVSLSETVETVTSIPLNEWYRISEHQQFSHQPELSKNTQVFSTKSREESKSVWIKVQKD